MIKDNFNDTIQFDITPVNCISCEEDPAPDDPVDYDNYKCAKSKWACGHHCNHSWTNGECCWCGYKDVPNMVNEFE